MRALGKRVLGKDGHEVTTLDGTNTKALMQVKDRK
jgi:hypothetical protein